MSIISLILSVFLLAAGKMDDDDEVSAERKSAKIILVIN